jgi:hypothetical protein
LCYQYAGIRLENACSHVQYMAIYVEEAYLFAIHGRLPPEQAAKAVIPSCGQRLLLMALNKAQTDNISAAKSQHKQAQNCMVDVDCHPI